MHFNDYQEAARSTAIYPSRGLSNSEALSYVALGLNGEAGEVAEKVKKLIRDKGGIVDDEFKDAIKKEMGDQLWYLSNMASELGLTLSEIAEGNLAKLFGRRERGTLQGSGDNR